jgi:hypothetical protein
LLRDTALSSKKLLLVELGLSLQVGLDRGHAGGQVEAGRLRHQGDFFLAFGFLNWMGDDEKAGVV